MGLKRLIARRIILSVSAAIGVVTVIFAALLSINPVMRVAFFVSSPRELAPGRLQILIQRYGLDQRARTFALKRFVKSEYRLRVSHAKALNASGKAVGQLSSRQPAMRRMILSVL